MAWWMGENRLKVLEWNLCKCWKGAFLFNWPNKRYSLCTTCNVHRTFFYFFRSLISLFSFARRNWRAEKRALPWSSATRSTVHFNPFWALLSQHKRIINRMNTTNKKYSALCSIFTPFSLFRCLSHTQFHWLQRCCSMWLLYNIQHGNSLSHFNWQMWLRFLFTMRACAIALRYYVQVFCSHRVHDLRFSSHQNRIRTNRV